MVKFAKMVKFHREIDCHSVNVRCYLKCKRCNEKETYIGKTTGENTKGFKLRINQQILFVRQGFQRISSLVMYTIVVLRIIAERSRSLV